MQCNQPSLKRCGSPEQDLQCLLRIAGTGSGQDNPSQHIAALLSGIWRNNSYEGHDPGIIPDSSTSGFVAELLGLTISELAESLVELEDLGLVAHAQAGALRLLDRPELDRLIDAH